MFTVSDLDGVIVGGFLAVFAGFFLVGGIIAYVVGSLFLMRIFEKAGVQGAWRAWVPGYNAAIYTKLGDISPWWMLGGIGISILLAWVPGLGFVGNIVSFALLVLAALASWRVGLKIGNKEWFWLLLWLIPGVGTLVWLGIVAFDKAPWNPNIVPAPWAKTALADTTVWDGVPVQPGQSVAGGTAPGAGGYAPGGAPAAPGYAPPGYMPPPAAAPSGYTAPPAGYVPPATGPAAPAAPPAGYTPPPSADSAPPSDPNAPRV